MATICYAWDDADFSWDTAPITWIEGCLIQNYLPIVLSVNLNFLKKFWIHKNGLSHFTPQF